MDIIKSIFDVIKLLIEAFILTFLAGFFLNLIFIIKKVPKMRFKTQEYLFYDKKKHTAKIYNLRKRKVHRTLKYLLNKRMPKWYEFSKWIIIDMYRGRERFELFGIWCFTGYYGEGKTLGAINYAFKIRKEYPWKNIKIFSNFNLKGQNGKIEKWQDLLTLPVNSIVIFDEIQSTFTSSKFKEFPIELLWKLTQCRKQGLAIFCSSPVYSRMTIQLRESTDYVIICKNVLKLKRLFTYSFYKAPEYEKYQEDKLKLKMHREFKFTFVAQDMNYKRYNTHQIVDRFDIEPENDIKIVKTLNKSDVIKLVDDRIKQFEKKIA